MHGEISVINVEIHFLLYLLLGITSENVCHRTEVWLRESPE